MKTYTKKIEVPRLQISHDEFSQSPREDSNLGYFVVCSDKYTSPDDNRILKDIIKETQYQANNAEEHARLIADSYEKEAGEEVIFISPVNTYEHGNIAYRLGTGSGFDCSNNGFYVVTKKTAEQITHDLSLENIERIIKNELDIYTQWVNGEVFMFKLYDEEGQPEEAIGGFYDLDSIKSYLPEEWAEEDMNKYFTGLDLFMEN